MVSAAAPAAALTASDEIPILDLGPFFAGEPGALEKIAEDLHDASTRVGFYYLKNHGVPEALIDQTFVESERFHALPIEPKRAIKLDRHKIGYMELATSITRHSDLAQGAKANLYAAFCLRLDLDPNDPEVLAGKPFRAPNQWPEGLPGFRENIMAYQMAMEGLGKRLLPIFAQALDVAPDFFDAAFRRPLVNMQLNYYPDQPLFSGDQFGIAPHTDRGFITILCQAKVPGLEIRTADERWVTAPVLPGHFLVNTGDLLRRWTNDRYLSTPHRVINASRGDRHSIPYFFNPDTDTLVDCFPSCRDADGTAKYPPITLLEFYEWFVKQNYPEVVTAMAKAG